MQIVEKGFVYYFHIVWDALDNKNFIDMVEIRMNPDLKTGLFYVMECYDLGFSEDGMGNVPDGHAQGRERGKTSEIRGNH